MLRPVPSSTRTYPLFPDTSLFRSLLGHRVDGVDRRICDAQSFGVIVVGMLVVYQDCARAIHGLGIGEHPRIEHDDVPIVLHTHAGIAELGDPHAVESRESAPSWQTETAPARAAVRRHRRPHSSRTTR